MLYFAPNGILVTLPLELAKPHRAVILDLLIAPSVSVPRADPTGKSVGGSFPRPYSPRKEGKLYDLHDLSSDTTIICQRRNPR